MFIDFTRCKKYPKSIECAKVWVKFTQGVKRLPNKYRTYNFGPGKIVEE